MADEKLTLSVMECAKILGIGRNLCYTLCKKGQIPVLKCGRRLVIPRAALEKLLTDPNPSTTQRHQGG